MNAHPMRIVRRTVIAFICAGATIFCIAQAMNSARAHSEMPSSDSVAETVKDMVSESSEEIGPPGPPVAPETEGPTPVTEESAEIVTELPQGIPPVPDPPSLPPEGF